MKNFLTKFKYLLIGLGLALASTALAVNVTIPQATQKGDIPVGNANGTYNAGHLTAGSNITIDTSTTGSILITATAGGAGCTVPGSDTQLVYNASAACAADANLVWLYTPRRFGINSTTPIAALTVLNKPNTLDDILRVSTSSGASYLVVASNGSTTLSSLPTGPVYSSTGALFTAGTTGNGAVIVQQTSPTLITPILGTASSTALSVANNLYTNLTNTFVAASNNGLLIATTTPLLSISALSGPIISVATTSDTNIVLSISTTTANTLTFQPSFTGTLAANRLNSSVVQGVSTSTLADAFTAAISAQSMSIQLPANLINFVATTSSSGTFYVSTSTVNSTSHLTINFPNNLLTSVSADSPLGGNGTSGSHLTCTGCLTSAITSIGLQTGPGLGLATSSDTNIVLTIDTSTANTIKFVPGFTGNLAVSRGGTGTTTWQSGSIPFYNGSNFTENNQSFLWQNTTRSLLINTTTPTGAALAVYASSSANTLPIFIVGTTTGSNYLTVAANGSTTLSTLGTGCVGASTGALYTTPCGAGGGVTASGTPGMVQFFNSSGALDATQKFQVAVDGTRFAMGTTSTSSTLTVQGVAGTANIFTLASSSLGNVFTVGPSGSTTLSTLGTGCVGVSTGSLYTTPCGLTTAITSINGATGPAITFATGTTGTDFNLSSSTNVFTWNIPTAANGVRGLLNSTDWNTFNNKGSSNLTASGTPGFIQFFGTSSSALNATAQFQWDNVGARIAIGTTSTTSTFTLQGQAGAQNLFTIASSSLGSVFTIAASGNVGIGSSTPTGDLTIQGSSGGTNDLLRVASSSNVSLFNISAAGYVGIGSTTPTANLVVQGTAGQTVSVLTVASSTGVAMLSVTPINPTSASTFVLNVASSSAASLLTVDGYGNTTLNHLIGSSTLPTVATSTGLGTGGCTLNLCQAVVITGSTDLAGAVKFGAGTGPAANTTLWTVTFSRAFTNAPFCQLTNASSTTSTFWATTTASTLVAKSNTALAASSDLYELYWHCTGQLGG